MTDQPMYHEGMRSHQDARETRPLADRLEQVALRGVTVTGPPPPPARSATTAT